MNWCLVSLLFVGGCASASVAPCDVADSSSTCSEANTAHPGDDETFFIMKEQLRRVGEANIANFKQKPQLPLPHERSVAEEVSKLNAWEVTTYTTTAFLLLIVTGIVLLLGAHTNKDIATAHCCMNLCAVILFFLAMIVVMVEVALVAPQTSAVSEVLISVGWTGEALEVVKVLQEI